MNKTEVVALLSAVFPALGAPIVVDLHRVPGGISKETWSCNASWSAHDGVIDWPLIIRRDREGKLFDSDLEREFELLDVLHRDSLPVPAVYGIARDGSRAGRPAIVMERVAGTSDMHVVATFPEFAAMRVELPARIAKILSDVHAVPIERFERMPSTTDCAQNEVARWESLLSSTAMEPQPVLALGLSWLRRNCPPPTERLALIHGDFRFGNFLFDRDGTCSVLDWELAHVGDPVEDLAWFVSKPWRRGDRVGGLCTRDEFVALYEAASGVTVCRDRLKFWEVLASVKLGVLVVSGERLLRDGKPPDLMLAISSLLLPSIELEITGLIR